MADKLTPEALNAELVDLDGWSVRGDAIVKVLKFADFDGAMKFVNQVAALARQRNHHPDIDIRYDTVTMTLSTHSAGGVTDQDIELAKSIEGI